MFNNTLSELVLMSSTLTGSVENDASYNAIDHSEDAEESFEEVYNLMWFLAFVWIIGKIFTRTGLPGLVGEIISGIILGPNLLDFVPEWETMIVIGDIGLVLLVLEAGIDVDIGMLKLIGTRGLYVAIFGSMMPLIIGAAIAYSIGSDNEDALLSAIRHVLYFKMY